MNGETFENCQRAYHGHTSLDPAPLPRVNGTVVTCLISNDFLCGDVEFFVSFSIFVRVCCLISFLHFAVFYLHDICLSLFRNAF